MRSFLAAIALLAASCASAPAVPVLAPDPPKQAPIDLCKDAPPLLRDNNVGILRHARCEKEIAAIMTGVGADLGVACTACHASKEDYRATTPRREIANWMATHLMSAIKPADGSPMLCRSCHTDALGQPVLKILGEKRDPVKVNEWMSLVMARRFVAADGTKLKCKSCHVGTPGTAEFRAKVIGVSDQLPKHVVGGQSTSSH